MVVNLTFSRQLRTLGNQPRPTVSARYSEDPYGTEDLQREAFWRTLVAGRNGRGKLAPESYATLLDIPWNADSGRFYGTYGRAFQEIGTQNIPFRFAGRDFQDYFLQEVGGGRRQDADSNWYLDGDPFIRVVGVLWGRRLITTKKGYIGIADRNARQKDLLCILLGCDVPAILRPPGDAYTWTGESYAHDLMEGQAMKGLADGPDTSQDIVIL
ncbi:hypothetical protein G7Y89_g9452 [Cudoniella acicularis]|uniref:Uncharacterized protein n=1 Tax=Cudoniella acicularis TaxID=354080 RepID=A0A8H4REM1_9HELO|nr:hypothetical protein G7Y89_g9452 [Cudoniella acicularis]